MIPNSPAHERILDIETDHPSLRVDEEALRLILENVLAGASREAYRVSVILTQRETVHELNRTYLSHDYPTDVLSFDLGEESEEVIEGEVYVDLDTAEERCAEFGSDFQTEAFRYAIHGLLHLTGYEDDTPERKQEMARLEDRYLNVGGNR